MVVNVLYWQWLVGLHSLSTLLDININSDNPAHHCLTWVPILWRWATVWLATIMKGAFGVVVVVAEAVLEAVAVVVITCSSRGESLGSNNYRNYGLRRILFLWCHGSNNTTRDWDSALISNSLALTRTNDVNIRERFAFHQI